MTLMRGRKVFIKSQIPNNVGTKLKGMYGRKSVCNANKKNKANVFKIS